MYVPRAIPGLVYRSGPLFHRAHEIVSLPVSHGGTCDRKRAETTVPQGCRYMKTPTVYLERMCVHVVKIGANVPGLAC